MKRKNKIYLYICALMVITIGAFFYWPQKNYIQIVNSKKSQEKESKHSPLKNTEEMVLLNPNYNCEILKKSYSYLNELKKNESIDLRFENIHKKVRDKIYRLRHFYKDGDEGEIETFLVYLEDKTEMAKIIEKSPYTKGNIYNKIEKAKGEVLYNEEGFDLSQNDQGGLFLHYINNQLMGVQGTIQVENDHRSIECHFNKNENPAPALKE